MAKPDYALGVGEGTFCLVQGDKVEVIGDKYGHGNALYLNPKLLGGKITKNGDDYELTSLQAKRIHSSNQKEELIFFHKTTGNPRTSITNNPNDRDYNEFQGILTLENGAVLNLTTGLLQEKAPATNMQSAAVKQVNNKERYLS